MIVEIPNMGEIEFPDSMSQEDVTGVLKQKYNTPKLPNGMPQGFLPTLPQTDLRGPKTPQGLFHENNPQTLGQYITQPLVGVNPLPEGMTKDTGVIGGLEGLAHGVAGLASAGTTPGYAALPGVGKIPGVGPALLSTLGLYMGARGLQGEAQNLSQGPVTAQKLGEAVPNVAADVLMAGSGVHGLGEAVRPSPVPSGIRPQDFPVGKIQDMPYGPNGEILDPNRQLRDAQINVAPGGQAVREGTLSPKEEREFAREAQARAIHQPGSAQEAMIKAAFGKTLGKPALSSPSQIEDVLGVSRGQTGVKGIQESPSYPKNQEMPFNEVWNRETQKAGIGNFGVKLGDQVVPVNSIDDALATFKAAAVRSKMTPEQLAKKGPFPVMNREGFIVGHIDENGNFKVKPFGGPDEPPTQQAPGSPVPKGPTPQLPGSTKALPPGANISEAGERKPPAPIVGEQPPVVSPINQTAKDLGLKVKQWPKEVPVVGGTYSLTDPKTGLTIEGLTGTETPEAVTKRFADKGLNVKKPVSQKTLDMQHDLKGTATSLVFAKTKGFVTPEQAATIQKFGDHLFDLMSQGQDVSQEAKALSQHVNQINEEGLKNASNVRTDKAGVPGTAPRTKRQGPKGPLGGDIQLDTGGKGQSGPRPVRQEGQGQAQAQEANARPFTQEELNKTRPAIRRMDGTVIKGQKGDAHNDIISRFNIKPENLDRRGFVGPKGEWIDREDPRMGSVLGNPESVPGAHAPVLADVQTGVIPKGWTTRESEVMSATGTEAPRKVTEIDPPAGIPNKETYAARDKIIEDLAKIGIKAVKDGSRVRVVEGSLPKPKGIGGGITAAIEKNQRGEEGFINIGAVVDKYEEVRRKLASAIDARTNKKDILRDKDVADNAAVIVGQRAGKGQEAMAKATFGPVWQQALKATIAAVEAGGDKNRLNKFIAQATAAGDGGKEGLANAKFALNNWDKIQPLVARNKFWNDRAFNAAKGQDLDVDYRNDYIRHLYDLNKLPQTMLDKFFSTGSGTGGKGYKKERVFNTIYDAIEAGYGPAIKTWNSADLLENRLRTGFQEVNDLQWAKSFAKVKDPTTGKGIISLTEKPGYTPMNQLSQKVYVHRGYENVFNAAAAASGLRNNVVGSAVLHGIGTLKHSFLAYDSYHASRMAAKAAAIKGTASFKKGVTLLEYDPSDLKNAVKAGDITQEMADWANANRSKANLALKTGFNVGRVQATLDADFWRKYNPLGTGTANKWIFEKLTRGAMLESWVREFDRQKAQNPGMSDIDMGKKVSRDLNFNFGSIGRQGLLRSKTAQDLARVVFLAPEWFESMLQTEGRSIGQAAKIPFTGKVGTLARSTGVLLGVMFVATQIANIASTGHTTWTNPKGHAMDAWVPGLKGLPGDRGDGYWVSPFSVPMEITHDIIRYRAEGDSPLKTASQIIGNKLAPIPRAVGTLLSQRDYAGRPMTDKETYKAAAMDVLPIPLAAQAPIKGEPLQRQLMAQIGIKGEPAQSPRERIAQYARQFNENRGVKEGVYPQSEYTKLLNLLRMDKLDDAKKEYGDLINKKVGQGSERKAAEAVVEKYFTELPERIYTGEKKREDEFYHALDDAGKEDYKKVRSTNKAISEEFFSDILGHGPKPKKGRRKFSAFDYQR